MNPFKKVWKGLKFAGRKSLQGAAFARMLSDMGVPIPFIRYLKLGMTIAELGQSRGAAKAWEAKDAAIRLAKARGVDVSRVPGESIDLLIQLLLSPATNDSTELAFDVESAASRLSEAGYAKVRRAFESAPSSNQSVSASRSSLRQAALDSIASASRGNVRK